MFYGFYGFYDEIGVVFAVYVVAYAAWGYSRAGWKVAHQRVVGGLIVAYGAFLATLTGTVTSLVLPGIGSIALGATTGAAVGFATWLVIGTVGVVTGGVGVALGAISMAAIGGLCGTMGGAAGGFGLQTFYYPLVNPIFWIPLMALGGYFLLGKRKTKQQTLTLEEPKS